MYIAVIIVCIALGAFILAPRFLGENEDAAAVLEKVTPFQGIIGLIVVVGRAIITRLACVDDAGTAARRQAGRAARAGGGIAVGVSVVELLLTGHHSPPTISELYRGASARAVGATERTNKL